MSKKPIQFEVQHYSLFEGWKNHWTDTLFINGKRREKKTKFLFYGDAERELETVLFSGRDYIQHQRDEYRIVKSR